MFQNCSGHVKGKICPINQSEDTRRIQNPVEHLEMQLFAKIVNGFQPLTLFTKNSALDVRLGFK